MKKTRSMKWRLVIPFCLILIFQTIFMMAFLSTGNVAQGLYQTELRSLKKDVENSGLLLEREVLQHWMNDIRSSVTIQTTIQSVLKEEGKKASDISHDWELNERIIGEIMPDVLELLHRSYGNSIYVVLDGPSAQQSAEGHQAGISVLDTDSSSFAADNSDLQLSRGAAVISKQFKIPLASDWKLDFDMSEEIGSGFYNPYFLTKGQKLKGNIARFAFLGPISGALQADTDGVSYSIPLTAEDGTVIGVLGGTMLKEQIYSLLKNELLHKDEDTILMLAKRGENETVLTPVLTYGMSFHRSFEGMNGIGGTATRWNDIQKTQDQNGDWWYLASKELPVYGRDSAFYRTSWQIVVLRRQSVMRSFYQKLLNGLLSGCAFAMIPGILFALMYGTYFSLPIRRLICQLRSAEDDSRIHLQPTYISELDELSHAIEYLSADVAESALRISRILEGSGVPIGVFEYLPDRKKVFCSRTLFELLGLEQTDRDYTYLEETGFRKMMQILGPGVKEHQDVRLYHLQANGKERYFRLKIVRAENGNETGVLLDVTEELEYQKRLELERDYDPLTELYNRPAFRRNTLKLLQSGRISCGAMLMWDLDNLKYVNDNYGHEMGDRYIRLFADQLKTLNRYGAVVERHSGDEFMAFLCGNSEEELRGILCELRTRSCAASLKVSNQYELPLRASAGVAWYPRQARDFETLVRYADFAMYMAKHSTKGVLQEFDLESYQKNSYLLSGQEEINRLLEQDDVPFAAQPIVCRDGSLYGYELLMRPETRNFKNIQEVLNLAKRQAKLPQFERLTWVGAFRWLFTHKAEIPSDCHIFINSIANVSLDPDCMNELLRKYPDFLKHVVVEITEGEAISSRDMEFKMETIRRTGSMIALDDFGSGYSSEGTLLNMEVNIVKLDMGLVSGIDKNRDKQELAANLIHYCKERNILVLAEGVERIEEVHTMLLLGADLFQGYYFGRPELEIRPVNPYVIEKMRKLLQK